MLYVVTIIFLTFFVDDVFFFFIVDVATHEKDPLRRIAFVAGFAMANYSSTIGRIAKPFNPMLVSLFFVSSFLCFFVSSFLQFIY